MKWILTFILAFTLIACKKQKTNNATILKNCTGDYIAVDNKVYKVCNNQTLSWFTNGQKVQVTYKKNSTCSSGNIGDGCKLLFKFDDWVEVVSIK